MLERQNKDSDNLSLYSGIFKFFLQCFSFEINFSINLSSYSFCVRVLLAEQFVQGYYVLIQA